MRPYERRHQLRDEKATEMQGCQCAVGGSFRAAEPR
jgi:hypothetical protein